MALRHDLPQGRIGRGIGGEGAAMPGRTVAAERRPGNRKQRQFDEGFNVSSPAGAISLAGRAVSGRFRWRLAGPLA